jgi:tetratricopeptide (TPR) repeat protein
MRTHINLLIVCLLGLCAIAQRAAAHSDDEIFPPVAQAAQAHLKQGRYAEALAAAEAWAAEATADSRAFGLAATAAVFTRDKVKALLFARKAVELSPAAIAPRASLVLALQLSGSRRETQIARAELYELWQKSDATSQRLASFKRDDFDHEGKKIVVTEFFEPHGPRALKYEFFVYEGAGGSIAYRISLGSSEKDGGGRSYRLDRYFPDNSHEALGSFKSELSYDQVKALAVSVVSGKRKLASATPVR